VVKSEPQITQNQVKAYFADYLEEDKAERINEELFERIF
jgi:hypothetical protein